jgi:hypothetical protein
MVTVAPAAPNGDNGNHQGYCSQCGKVWTLKERQGVCQWCLKPASCQYSTSKPRHIKSRSNGRRKQPNSNGNGYDHLEGEWLTYYKVALPFANSVPDREDLLHTIISNLADVERNNGHKPFTEAVMYRIASRAKDQYWRNYYRHINGLDCGRCSNKQRRKCKRDWLYGKCPKLVKIESLNKPIADSEGNLTELGELIADDKALDLDAWLDIKTFLLTSPERLILIGEKIRDGIALTKGEHCYIQRFRKREQKKLFQGEQFLPLCPNTIVAAR